MFVKALALFFLLGASSAFAANDPKDLSTVDVIVAPYFAPQYGTYKAGSVDNGSLGLLQFGARLGLKLGPVLLGGEFGGAHLLTSSSQANVSTADQQKYTAGGSGSSLHIGINGGLLTDRWAFIATYFPIMTYDASSIVSSTSVSSKYSGSSYGAEINYRIHNRFYAGLYASTREFKTYTSGALTDAPLDPKWESLTYGLTLTYLVGLSDFAKLPDLFNSL